GRYGPAAIRHVQVRMESRAASPPGYSGPTSRVVSRGRVLFPRVHGLASKQPDGASSGRRPPECAGSRPHIGTGLPGLGSGYSGWPMHRNRSGWANDWRISQNRSGDISGSGQTGSIAAGRSDSIFASRFDTGRTAVSPETRRIKRMVDAVEDRRVV